MRQGQQKNRMRNRPRKGGISASNINPGNNLNRSYESNGPDVKVRGTPALIAEKYQQLARDATSAGDRVAAENYYQHAEHYLRIIAAAQAAQAEAQERRRQEDERRRLEDERRWEEQERRRQDEERRRQERFERDRERQMERDRERPPHVDRDERSDHRDNGPHDQPRLDGARMDQGRGEIARMPRGEAAGPVTDERPHGWQGNGQSGQVDDGAGFAASQRADGDREVGEARPRRRRRARTEDGEHGLPDGQSIAHALPGGASSTSDTPQGRLEADDTTGPGDTPKPRRRASTRRKLPPTDGAGGITAEEAGS